MERERIATTASSRRNTDYADEDESIVRQCVERHRPAIVRLTGLANDAGCAIVSSPSSPSITPLTPANRFTAKLRCRMARPVISPLFHSPLPCFARLLAFVETQTFSRWSSPAVPRGRLSRDTSPPILTLIASFFPLGLVRERE